MLGLERKECEMVQKLTALSFICAAISSWRKQSTGVFLTRWVGKVTEVFLKTTDVFTMDALKDYFQERLLLDWLRSVFTFFWVCF